MWRSSSLTISWGVMDDMFYPFKWPFTLMQQA
jgi:hypothetical protein